MAQTNCTEITEIAYEGGTNDFIRYHELFCTNENCIFRSFKPNFIERVSVHLYKQCAKFLYLFGRKY